MLKNEAPAAFKDVALTC